jgi:hypothetical protein
VHGDLPPVPGGLNLVERQRGRQIAVGVDLLLQVGDLLLGQGDRVGAGDDRDVPPGQQVGRSG